MRFGNRLFTLIGLLVANPVWAGVPLPPEPLPSPPDVLYEVLLDTDQNDATGCTYRVSQGLEQVEDLSGFEFRVTLVRGLNIESPDTEIVAETIAACNAGSWGAETAIQGLPTPWPVGRDVSVPGLTGARDVTEGVVELGLLGSPSSARVVVHATNDQTLQSDYTSAATVVFDSAAVPTLSEWSIMLLALLIASIAFTGTRKHFGAPAALLVAAIIGGGSVGTARALVNPQLDGAIDDWTGDNPVLTDPADDMDPHAPVPQFEDLREVYIGTTQGNLYIRIDTTPLPIRL